MNAVLSYLCVNCGEIEERCAVGRCPHCLSDEVFSLSALLKSAGVEITNAESMGAKQ